MKNEELKKLLTLFLSQDTANETLAIQMIYALELSDVNKLLDMMSRAVDNVEQKYDEVRNKVQKKRIELIHNKDLTIDKKKELLKPHFIDLGRKQVIHIWYLDKQEVLETLLYKLHTNLNR